MPSPDLASYHELTLFDRTPSQFRDQMLADAAVKFPGWVPRTGNLEVVLAESLALACAELGFAINRVPAAVAEVIIRLFGITPLPGTPATMNVRFYVADTLGHEIPVGTRVRLELGAGVAPVDFVTTAGVVIAPAASDGVAPAAAQVNSSIPNGAVVGTVLTVMDPLIALDRAVIDTAPSGGTDPESDADWRSRAIDRFTTLSSVLLLPAHFTSAALGIAPVYRAFTIDQWDSTAGGGAGAAANGHVTVGVMGQAGAALSGGQKTAVHDALAPNAAAPLTLHVIDATITNVNVTCTVKGLAGWTSGEVATNVAAAINAYLNPDVWPFAATVRINELIALIDGVGGVDYVVSIGAPATDVALTGAAPLARAGTVAVTVT